MRAFVVFTRLFPFVIAFLRDRKRFLLVGRPRRVSAEAHLRRARRLTITLAELGPDRLAWLSDLDEDIRAYRCLRRPRGAPQPVRCAVRYGMVFVNLDQRDHQVIDKRKREADRQAVERQTASADSLAATPRSA